MSTPVYTPTFSTFSAPYGPWGFGSSGTPVPQQFDNATFFSFGPSPYTATIANTLDGASSMPFSTLIFDESPNVWAGSYLGTGNLVASIYACSNGPTIMNF